MSRDEKLKPCPFCGGKAEVFNPIDTDDNYYVECYSEYNDHEFECCEARTSEYPTAQQAIQLWNTRPKNPSMGEEE